MPGELTFLALLMFGWQQDGTKPVTVPATQGRQDVAQKSKPKGPTWDAARKLPAGKGLYKDADVLKLTEGKRFDEDVFEEAVLLDVVPRGEAYPREDVFKALGIKESRLRDKRGGGLYKVVFTSWQISPSYDLSYMTASNDKSQKDVDFDSPKRLIYGIRIVKRVRRE
jgi:hypothetical protein